MEYELTKDCHYGKAGATVDRGVYLRATPEEKRTLFKEIRLTPYTTNSNNGSYPDSHQFRDDTLEWADNDTSSSVSSCPPTEDDSIEYGGGRFGGGGASSDYEDSGYGGSDDSSSDCGSDD